MGAILSRFRKKLSTKEVLEDIEKKLKVIDEFQQDTMERQKRVARRFLVIVTLVYIIAFVAYFFISSVKRFMFYYLIGLVAFALLSWLFYKGIRWYYTRQMVSNSEKSVELRKKKKKILEEVMDTETYKVAKEILDRFGDKPQPPPLELTRSPLNPRTPTSPVNQRPNSQGTELRQRHVNTEQKMPPPRMNLPPNLPPQPPQTPANMNSAMKLPQPQPQGLHTQRPVAMNYGHAPLRPLPRPILPRERGLLDRVMDFFVGDGPHQRYALICRHCGGHNGMALQEEFEFVSFYCCYCYQFNPPRKMRPAGPRLPIPPPTAPATPAVKPPEKKEDESSSEKVDERSEVSGKTSEEDDEEGSTEEDEEEESSKEEGNEEKKEDESEKMEVDSPEEDKVISDDASPDSSSLR